MAVSVTVDKKKAFQVFDTLVERWRAKSYPFNRPDAAVPQASLPPEIRSDPHTLASFYFYVCIYMRGGIESSQAFAALVRLWRAHPDFFDALKAQRMSEEYAAKILKKFVGWDSKSAGTSWVVNSKRLCETWGANPLNVLRGLKSYDEACRRIRNKSGKSEIRDAGPDGLGFRGFQFKMVSMLLYFYDWEGWLPRFIYPSPADFHNFRLAFATGAMKAHGVENGTFTINERVSKPWRTVVMQYLSSHNVTPVEFSDALWLYSLVLCGNSPFTVTREHKKKQAPLFVKSSVAERFDQNEMVAARTKQQVRQTCSVCTFESICSFAIPAQPYYRKGKFVLRPRPRLLHPLGPTHAPRPKDVSIVSEQQQSLM